jgi:RNA polymerase subunit RPABC4/transcription elongation factor Spt4
MAAQDTCPVCKSPDAQFKPPGGGSDGLIVQCPICGQFQLSRTLRGKLTALNDAEVAEEYAPR